MTSKGKTSKEFLQTQIDRLMRAYPAMAWDFLQIQLYRDCLKRLVEGHSEDKVGRAVEATILAEKYLELSSIAKNIPRDAVVRVRCPRCRDKEGFIAVLVDGEKAARMMRCKHDRPQARIRVSIDPENQPRQVLAVSADFLDEPTKGAE